MKQFLALLLSLFSTFSYSQDFNKRIFKNQEVTVYPFPASTYGIFPTLDSLADGTYIAYTLTNQKKENKIWIEVDPYLDTNIVQCKFEVHSGKRNGLAEVYDHDGYLAAKGNYVNDLQSGKWEYFNVKEELLGYAHYELGILQGEYKSFYSDGTIEKEGYWKDGMPLGEWKKYYKNQQLQEKFTLVSCLDWEASNVINKAYKEEAIKLDYGYGSSRRNTFTHLPYRKWNDMGTCQDGLVVRYNEKGEETYSEVYINGETESEEEEIIPDTTYFKNGKVRWYKEWLSDSLFTEYFKFKNGKTRGVSEFEIHELARTQNKMIDGLKVDSSYTYTYEEVFKRNAKRYNKKEVLVDSVSFNINLNGSNYRSENTIVSYHDNGTLWKIYKKDTLNKTQYFSSSNKKGYLTREAFSNNSEDSVLVKMYSKTGDLLLERWSYLDGHFNKVLFYNKGKLRNGTYKISPDQFDFSFGRIDLNSDDFWVLEDAKNSSNAKRNKNAVYKWEGELKDGNRDGLWIAYNHSGDILREFEFINGIPSGSHHHYNFAYNSTVNEFGRRVRGKLVRYLELSQSFDNGDLDGWLNIYYVNGQLKKKVRYIAGNATHEIFSYYDDGVPSVEVRKKDSIYEYRQLSYGYISSITEFTSQKGLNYYANYNESSYSSGGDWMKNGKYFDFDNAGNIATEGMFLNGKRLGEWTDWYESGVKKHTLYIPSIDEDSTMNVNYSYYKNDEERNGNHVYYYPDGKKSHEGKVRRKKRVGVWLFYNELGVMIKRITYDKKDYLHIIKKDTLTVENYGFYESWYGNGQKQTEGYILDEEKKFDCNQETFIKMQGMFFLSHWEKDGKQTLENGKGNLVTFHREDQWASYGFIKNGLEHGEWFYWTPDGLLEKQGTYEFGKKSGRWLSGDLEGANFVEKACYRPDSFSSDEEYEEYLSHLSREVRVIESFYYKGKKINYSGHLMFMEKPQKDD